MDGSGDPAPEEPPRKSTSRWMGNTPGPREFSEEAYEKGYKLSVYPADSTWEYKRYVHRVGTDYVALPDRPDGTKSSFLLG